MQREQLADLAALVVVAQERSFTRAAAKLGVTQSTLSHTIRRLEFHLGLRLLDRTTRSVAPTEAGERLLRTLRPAFQHIDSELASLSELREKPVGTIRITTSAHAADTILMPVLERLLPKYPEIQVEITVDYALTDVVTERFDAGIRLGEQVAKDVVAVRIGADMRMAVVAAPAYFAKRQPPRVPQELAAHKCINFRFPTSSGIYAWEFEKAGRQLKVRVNGQLTFNEPPMSLRAARKGLGIAYLPEDMVEADFRSGRLVRVLDDWCAPFSGYHLYYPSHRQRKPALAVLVEALRYHDTKARGDRKSRR